MWPFIILGLPVAFLALAPKIPQTGFVPGFQNGNAGNRVSTGSQPVFTAPLYIPQTPVMAIGNPPHVTVGNPRLASSGLVSRIASVQVTAVRPNYTPAQKAAIDQAVAQLNIPNSFRSRLMVR